MKTRIRDVSASPARLLRAALRIILTLLAVTVIFLLGFSLGRMDGYSAGYAAGYEDAAIYTVDALEAYADEAAGEIVVEVSYPDGTGLERYGIPVQEIE